MSDIKEEGTEPETKVNETPATEAPAEQVEEALGADEAKPAETPAEEQPAAAPEEQAAS